MTNLEFHIALDQELQKVGSYQYDSFLPEELDHWLNKGLDAFISLNLHKAQNRPGETFESEQEALDALRNLVTRKTSLKFDSGSNVDPKSIVFNLPENYRHYLSMEVVSEFCGKPRRDAVRLMSSDDFYQSLNNPYLRPKVYSPVLTILSQDKGELFFHKDVEPSDLTLLYIKKPAPIDGTNKPNEEYTDIPEVAHENIVGITARRITQSMLPLNYQHKIQENMLNQDV